MLIINFCEVSKSSVPRHPREEQFASRRRRNRATISMVWLSAHKAAKVSERIVAMEDEVSKIAGRPKRGKRSAKSGTGVNSASTGVTHVAAASEPNAEEVRLRAYHLFLARGGEHGRDVEDWLQAERELTKAAPAKPKRRHP